MPELEYLKGDDGVATILLNRPGRKNAFTLTMLDLWHDALEDSRTDPSVGAVVLRGEGGAFCSGIDLDALEGLGTEPIAHKRFLQEQVQRIPRAVEALDKPLIACVSGPAVGAGMDMSLMCDLRFAGRTARFCESYLRVGLVPGAGGCYYLPRIVGLPKALELFMSAEFLDAEEALRIGLVNRVYDEADLLAETYAFAARLAAGPPIATAMLKRTVYQSVDCDLRTALDLVSSHLGVVRSTHDSSESLDSFRAGRTPNYVGQ